MPMSSWHRILNLTYTLVGLCYGVIKVQCQTYHANHTFTWNIDIYSIICLSKMTKTPMSAKSHDVHVHTKWKYNINWFWNFENLTATIGFWRQHGFHFMSVKHLSDVTLMSCTSWNDQTTKWGTLIIPKWQSKYLSDSVSFCAKGNILDVLTFF